MVFLTGSALKVLSVLRDGKIPTKKGKVRVKTSHFLCEMPLLSLFLIGILPSPTLRTFRAEPVKKTTLYVPLAVECYLFDHIYINKTYPI